MKATIRGRGLCALLLSVFLFCGIFSGCGNQSTEPDGKEQDEENHSGLQSESLTPLGSTPDDDPDSAKELLLELKKLILALPDAPDSDTDAEIWQTVTAIKESVNEWPSLDENGNSIILEPLSLLETQLTDLRSAINELLGDNEEETERTSALKTLRGGLSDILSEIAVLRTLIEAENIPVAMEKQLIEIINLLCDVQSQNETLRESVKSAQEEISELCYQLDGTRKSSWIDVLNMVFSGLSFVAVSILAALVFLDYRNRTDDKNVRKRTDKLQEIVRKTVSEIVRKAVSETADEKVGEVRETVSSEAANIMEYLRNASSKAHVAETDADGKVELAEMDEEQPHDEAQPIYAFVIDSKSKDGFNNNIQLKSSSQYEQFSGVSVPDREGYYYIWPDPWALGFVPREGQELKEVSTTRLYHGYVKKCFAVDPKDAGNKQSFNLTLTRYAVIRQEGNGYQLDTPGEIKATATS